jgi:hypothetical protein
MAPDIRATNLYLARHLCDGLGKLAAALGPATNEAALIKMGQGKKAVSDAMAKDIEEKLGLPSGWMDRDNEGLMKIESLDYALCKQILSLNDNAKKGLLSFVSSLRS